MPKGAGSAYNRSIESRHNQSAESRSVGAHAILPAGHPLRAVETMPACPSGGHCGSMEGVGGRQGSLPASNKSVSDRSGPKAFA